MTNPVFCAVDTADKDHARALAARVAGRVGGIKLGLEFFMANGREGVAAVAGEGGAPAESLLADGTLRLLPHQRPAGQDGFYVARFVRGA